MSTTPADDRRRDARADRWKDFPKRMDEFGIDLPLPVEEAGDRRRSPAPPAAPRDGSARPR